MKESLVEGRLKAKAKAAGGVAHKWVSPSFTGLPDRIVLLPVPPEDYEVVNRYVKLVEAPHPYPGLASLEAARHIEAIADRAQAEDLVICLFAGGGSALLTRPGAGIRLGELGLMKSPPMAQNHDAGSTDRGNLAVGVSWPRA